jgi:hypothetical protein
MNYNLVGARKLKHLLTSLLLIAVLSSLTVRTGVSPSTPTIALDPTPCSGWLDPNPFSHVYVDARVTDAPGIASWQIQITWDTNYLALVGGYEGTFLSGNPSEEWDSNAWDYAVLPILTVTGEPVGMGDGSTTVFYVDYTPVKPNSQTIYVGGTPNYNYYMEYETGTISFGIAPGAMQPIIADYSYFGFSVADPELASDRSSNPGWANTYANFKYSDADGAFVVGNFSREPYGSEFSQILNVEMGLRYSAALSTLSDQYRIVYYVGTPSSPGTKIVLADWTSTAAPLATHIWSSVAEPTDGEWSWDDLWRTGMSGLHIAVETDRVGGDSNAVFQLYEAWLVVTYARPTFKAYVAGAGYAVLGSTALGEYPPMTGSGVLGTFEFVVIGTGTSALTIDYTSTYLADENMAKISPIVKSNGQYYPPIAEDINGDATVDILDLSWVGINYMKTGADIWPEQADVYPKTTPDGIVTIMDLATVAIKYGYTYP